MSKELELNFKQFSDEEIKNIYLDTLSDWDRQEIKREPFFVNSHKGTQINVINQIKEKE